MHSLDNDTHQQMEDIILVECTEDWDAMVLCKVLDKYLALSGRLYATWSGDVVHRKRRASSHLSQQWLILLADPENFPKQIARNISIELDDLFC